VHLVGFIIRSRIIYRLVMRDTVNQWRGDVLKTQ